jgi:DNA-binding NtrC family response regulator
MCRITLPSLAERIEEIPTLCLLFVKEFIKKYNKAISGIEAGIIQTLAAYSWPGNVRELKNVLFNNLLFCDDTVLREKKFQMPETAFTEQLHKTADKDKPLFSAASYILPDTTLDLEQLTKELILAVIDKFNGNKSMAAKYLNITRTQLYHKLGLR